MAEILPQSNARLKSISSAGTAEDFDQAEGAGGSKWSGDADAYYSEKRQRVTGPDGSSVVVTRSLIIPGDLAAIEIVDGDVCSILFRGQTQSVEVRKVERREGPPGTLRTIRLTLRDG